MSQDRADGLRAESTGHFPLCDSQGNGGLQTYIVRDAETLGLGSLWKK